MSMTLHTPPTHWIEQKKRGETHTELEIHDLVQSFMAGRMENYQLSAWLMAVCLNGLNEDETYYLTKAFVESGETLNLHGMGIEGITVDKHSTGGVGDKTTLIVAPLMAAAGLKVVKLSGRGLGFTGGTIDKLEAIPHFKVSLNEAELVQQVQAIGIALSSQTPKLTPADGVFYALRDVTATVDNLSLIAASVMSKKIAAGADVIVLDIKAGNGAFMKTVEDAEALADLCQRIGRRFGKRVETIVSDMNTPLGKAVGHTVEIIEAIETLQGKGHPNLTDLCVQLTSLALVAAERFTSAPEADAYVRSLLQNGQAYKTFKTWIQAQGGDLEALEHHSLLPQPMRKMLIPSPLSGKILSINALAVAKVVKALGGGRSTIEDVLDYSVGVILHQTVGAEIEAGEPLFEMWVGSRYDETLQDAILEAIEIA